MSPKKPKIFILDTNVILHDSSCLYQFQDNDIVIPMPVLEELDHFKSGHLIINFHARNFLRAFDSISNEHLFSDGEKIAEDKGRIFVTLDREFHPDIAFNFTAKNPDHHILNIAYCLARENTDRQVILVTKDVNLRMKAKAIGLLAKDFRKDHVEDITKLYRGFRRIEGIDENLINSLYQKPGVIEKDRLVTKEPLMPNEFLILRNGKHSVLARYDPFTEKIWHLPKKMAQGIMPRNAEQIFALNALTDNRIKLVTLSGKAGTGKTLLALAGGMEGKKDYKQIFLARPVVPLSNKDIGYLPGSIKDKLDPYMQPLFDNLGLIRNTYLESDSKHHQTKTMMEKEKLVITPLSYIRGRSLVNVYFIVDEAQNLTPHEIKTVITRAGEDTKLVFTGDIFQIDHPYLDTHTNGLSYLIDKMKGQKLYAHINLEKGERSELAELASDLL